MCNFIGCCKDLACIIAVLVFILVVVVLAFVIVLFGRFGAATYAYVSKHDGDWNVEHILTSHEFWDMDEADYWYWGLILLAVIVVFVLLFILALWLIACFCCGGVASCMDRVFPRWSRYRKQRVWDDSYEMDRYYGDEDDKATKAFWEHHFSGGTGLELGERQDLPVTDDDDVLESTPEARLGSASAVDDIMVLPDDWGGS